MRAAIATIAICAGLLLHAGRPLRAQSPSPADEAKPVLQTRSPADLSVTVDAVAPQGADLARADDLWVEDNGRRAELEQIQRTGAGSPQAEAQLLFILDLVNASQQEFVRSVAALSAFLRSHNGKLAQRASILFVSMDDTKGAGTPGKPSQNTANLEGRGLSVHRLATTTDGTSLAAELKGYAKALTAKPDPGTANDVAERVRLSLEALSFVARAEAEVPGAKVTIWLSPGWPYLSRSEARSSAQLFDSVVYFNDALRAARMLLYMVDPSGVANQPTAETNAFQPANGATLRVPVINTAIGQDFYKGYTKGVRKPEESNPNDLTLQVLAVQSGGLVLQGNNDIQSMIARCSADAGRLITLTYRPSRTPGGIVFHQLRIRTKHPAQTLRAPTSFYTR